MRKIYIVITFIMCLFLLGCNRKPEVIKNEKEILDFIYNGYLDEKRPEYDEKYKDYLYFQIRDELYDELDILSIYKNPEYKLYEAMVFEKKVIAGYIDNKTINKIEKITNESCDHFVVGDKGYSSLYPIYSKLYQEGSLSLEKDKTYIYSFNDGIPLEYDDKKLVFIIDYYEVSLNDDKIITPVMYVKGRVMENCFYSDISIIYIDYGLYLYQACTKNLVMSLNEFYCNSQLSFKKHINYGKKYLSIKTLKKEEFDLLSIEEQEKHLAFFELIKTACTYSISDYEYERPYDLLYEKLIEILINE